MTGELERRYRRLLAWYPAEHRARYQEEMLGVLLDCAGAGRTRPTAAETASILADALRARLRRLLRQRGTGPWSAAAAIVSLLAPAALLALRTHALLQLSGVGQRFSPYQPNPPIGPSVWAPAAAWALVVLAGLAGLRLAAAAFGWAALLIEVGVQGLEYARFGAGIRPPMWPLLLAAGAVLALSAGPGPRRALGPLGRWRIAALSVAGALYAAQPVLANNSATDALWHRILLPVANGGGAVVLACLALTVRVGGPLRRRMLALLAPLILIAALDEAAGFLNLLDDRRWDGWIVGVQAGALALLALAAVGLGAALVRRRERSPSRPAGPAV